MRDLLILASASPRRKALLKECNILFKAVNHGFDESSCIIKNPVLLAEKLAFGKAESVADNKKYFTHYVLGVDTIVVIKNKVLGKPSNPDDAEYFLKMLSGRKHKVITGISVINRSKNISITRHDTSFVYFDNIDVDFMKYYLDNKLWVGYAGGYAIQESIFNLIVKKIKGSYSNIVGLPVNMLYKTLQDVNFRNNIW